jgi:hypothetical protein
VFDDYLDMFTRPMLPWDRYYRGLALGSVLLFTGIWIHFYPVAILSWFVAILGVLTAFGILSATHYWYTQNTVPDTPPELHSTDD